MVLVESPRTLVAKPVQNVCDEVKLKTKHKYFISFSPHNKLLATYSPAFTQNVWIRNFRTGRIAAVVTLNNTYIQGIYLLLSVLLPPTRNKIFIRNCYWIVILIVHFKLKICTY